LLHKSWFKNQVSKDAWWKPVCGSWRIIVLDDEHHCKTSVSMKRNWGLFV
jgi:hypothetical protein